METFLPLLAAFVGAIGGLVVALLTTRSQRERLESELAFQRTKFEDELSHQRERLKAEFAVEESVEAALRHFLGLHLPYRSFQMIRHHIGGFQSNELRQLLVRAGAVRFMAADGTEMWALRERVADDFKHGRWKLDDSPLNKESTEDLFPGAFDNKTDY